MKNWETISNDPYFPSCTAQSLQILIFYLCAKNVWLPKKNLSSRQLFKSLLKLIFFFTMRNKEFGSTSSRSIDAQTGMMDFTSSELAVSNIFFPRDL